MTTKAKKKPAPKPRRRSAVDGRYTKSKAKRTTVEERGAKAIGAGWVVASLRTGQPWEFHDGRGWMNQVWKKSPGSDPEPGSMYQYVRLVAARPPKAVALVRRKARRAS